MDRVPLPSRSLGSLPPELLHCIVRLLPDITDLKNLRVTCKAIAPAVALQLFSTVVLKPNCESIKRMNHILKNNNLNGIVRHVVYCPYACSNGRINKRYLRHLVNKRDLLLFRFGNIDAVEIHLAKFFPFPFDSVFEEDEEDDDYEEDHINKANAWMQRLLSKVYRNVTTLTSLTILNLPNFPLHITHDPKAKFKPLIQGLSELHLSIDTMIYNKRQVDLRRIPYITHLCTDWIQPCASRLTSLSIHMKSYWGICLKPTLEDLYFPKLRQLTLWSFVFAYGSQFEWLIRHTKLESLSLIGCPIVVQMEIEPQTRCLIFDPSRFQGDITKSNLGFYIWRNALRWAPWLSHIETDLVCLRSFRFCRGHLHELASK